MFDLEAFEADFAAWDAVSRSGLDVHSASAGAIGLAERAEDAIAEIRRLRAEVASLRAAVAERAVFGIYDTTREPTEAP